MADQECSRALIAAAKLGAVAPGQARKLCRTCGWLTKVIACWLVCYQAEAHNVISTVASAAEGYPFVPPSWAPSVLVPFTGLVLPAIAMVSARFVLCTGQWDTCLKLSCSHVKLDF